MAETLRDKASGSMEEAEEEKEEEEEEEEEDMFRRNA